MATSDVTALGRSDLNQFLFADIGTEANGMTLSVMSVFARDGSDPWSVAGRLATLSKADAADTLAHMIAGMTRSLWAFPEAFVIAVRLIGLLPARPAARTLQVASRKPSGQTMMILACAGMAIAFALMMILR